MKLKFLPGIRISLVLSVRKEHGRSSADIWVGAQDLPDGPVYTWILSYLSALDTQNVSYRELPSEEHLGEWEGY